MNRWLVAWILMFGAQAVYAESCNSFRIRPQDHSALMSAATKTVEGRIDSKTLYACRYSRGLYARLYTIREKQPDGSRRRDEIECFRHREGSGEWECERYPERSVRLGSISAVPVSEVELPLWMDAEDATPLVALAYGSLASLTESNLCQKSRDDPAGVEAMRRSFLARDRGVLFFHGDSAANLSLGRNGHFVEFASDPAGPTAFRVDCWGELEELLE